MVTGTLNIRHGWVWLFSIFIFFFNTFLLPEGFTYTLLLTPAWVYFLYRQGRLSLALMTLIPLVLYGVVHIAHGVYLNYYFISLAVMITVLLFMTFISTIISNTTIDLDLIFRDIAILNFIFTLASLPFLFFPAIMHIVWYTVPLSQGIILPRLKLFTEEASHYSFLFAPIAIYFYSRQLFFKTTKPYLTLIIVTIPLILSFSLGVLSCMLAGGIVVVLLNFRKIFFTAKRKYSAIIFSIASVVLMMLAYKYYPGNPLFMRIHNIFTGDDTSARGRTYEAFILANKIIAQKSYLWGIGPGQLKIIGRDIIVQYYYYFDIPKVIRIPNAAAETIVYFGYVGFAIRLLIEFILFFSTKVYSNPYRLWLFIFVFIYQFTGSYITNIAEYMVWLLVFLNVFPEYMNLNTGVKAKEGNS